MINRKRKLLLCSLFIVSSLTMISCGTTDIENTDNSSAVQESTSDSSTEESTTQGKGNKPDIENMTDEEKAEFESKKGSKPDLENMTEEEKAAFESSKENKGNKNTQDSATNNATNELAEDAVSE